MKKQKGAVSLCHFILFMAMCLCILGIFFPNNLSTACDVLQAPLIGSKAVHFGNVAVGKEATRTLSVFNPHLSSIALQSLGTGCGCAVVTTFLDPIPPLHHGTIFLHIKSYRMGEGSEWVDLKTNRGTQRILVGYNVVRGNA